MILLINFRDSVSSFSSDLQQRSEPTTLLKEYPVPEERTLKREVKGLKGSLKETANASSCRILKDVN